MEHRFCSKEISPVNSMTAKTISCVPVTGASNAFGEDFAGQYAAQDRPTGPCGTAASLGTSEVIE
jgi:hypothetical protein